MICNYYSKRVSESGDQDGEFDWTYTSKMQYNWGIPQQYIVLVTMIYRSLGNKPEYVSK